MIPFARAIVGIVVGTVMALAAMPALAAEDGRDVFVRYCALCHGAAADGGGQMAKLLNPGPSDLRASKLTSAEKERIVRLGGASVRRSASMPAWENELSDGQLEAVLGYLDTVRRTASASR